MGDFFLNFVLYGIPTLFLFLYFLPFKEKDEIKTIKLLKFQFILIVIYLSHGTIDWIWGISFVGYWLDMFIELVFPFLIAGLSGRLSRFPKFWGVIQRLGSFIIILYFIGGWLISTIFGIHIVTGKYPAREIFNGRYFRIEEGGSHVTLLSDTDHGINIRYCKKYLFLEHRLKSYESNSLEKIEVIEETPDKLIFKPTHHGISQELKNQILE